MELLKSIIVDFCLFGLFEGIVYYYFIIKIYNCHKNKLIPLLIGILNSIITNIIPPILYHIIIILYLGIIIYYLKNKNEKLIKCIYDGFLIILFISIIEMIISIIIEILFAIDLYKINTKFIIIYIFSIIAKLIEMFIIYHYEKWRVKIMKVFIGEVVK